MLRTVATALMGALAVSLTACGGAGPGTGQDVGAPNAAELEVVASFYPLQFALESIGGERVAVHNLTPPGGEPHDLELTPKDVASVASADLVVFLSGYQPALDDAIATEAAESGLDVSSQAQLDLMRVGEDGQQQRDPHFWLDPHRLSTVAALLAERLAALDPAGSQLYADNLADLQAELARLDADYRSGLASCTGTALVTAHDAFGYLASRYGLEQVGIAGLSPEAEPTAADLARVTQFVRDHGVRAVYYETLVDPSIAETVAAETGVATAVLDPIEGLAAEAAGDYLSVMRANLESLRAGQPCP